MFLKLAADLRHRVSWQTPCATLGAMTVLRHQVPTPGTTVTARPYSGNKYAPSSGGQPVTAVSDAQGVATLTLPDPSSAKAYWALSRPGAAPVVVAIKRGASSVSSAAAQLGMLDAGSDLVSTRPVYDSTPDTDDERELMVPSRLSSAALKAALGSADPVLSAFVYDGLGNLTSYKEDGVTITLTYNADGTVATSQRGTGPVRAFSYSGGNLAGVA